MKRFNLSEWALAHQPLIRYLIVALAIVGVMSYQKLGQSEDPPFTFKVMVVRTEWPGASAREMEEQVTDRIEKKLQEVPNVDYLRSYSRPFDLSRVDPALWVTAAGDCWALHDRLAAARHTPLGHVEPSVHAGVRSAKIA